MGESHTHKKKNIRIYNINIKCNFKIISLGLVHSRLVVHWLVEPFTSDAPFHERMASSSSVRGPGLVFWVWAFPRLSWTCASASARQDCATGWTFCNACDRNWKCTCITVRKQRPSTWKRVLHHTFNHNMKNNHGLIVNDSSMHITLSLLLPKEVTQGDVLCKKRNMWKILHRKMKMRCFNLSLCEMFFKSSLYNRLQKHYSGYKQTCTSGADVLLICRTKTIKVNPTHQTTFEVPGNGGRSR